MKKQVGNITVEAHDARTYDDAFVVYLSVRTSTVKELNLLPNDARDLIYGLQWALGLHESSSGLRLPDGLPRAWI